MIDPAGLGNVVGEYTGSGNLIAHYIYGLGLASQVTASDSAYYYDFDALGNTVALTNGSGVKVNTYSYLPFGEGLIANASVPNPYQFVGRFGVQSDTIGIEVTRARLYATATGRFDTPDPLGPSGTHLNFYRYAANDPASYIDPFGLSTVESKIADVAGPVFDVADAIQPIPGRRLSVWSRPSGHLHLKTRIILPKPCSKQRVR